MAASASTTTPAKSHRRNVIAAAFGIAAAPRAATAATLAQPDAALIAMCDLAATRDAEWRVLCDASESPATERRMGALVRDLDNLRSVIAGMPAQTNAGLRAKLRVAMLDLTLDDQGEVERDTEAAIYSALQDALRLIPA